ncbi:hypothetical protein OG413_44745 [Streptomyces sp. NBC_01433]|uniref:hypothetical protein n=1 Tax=Streptomyces sp. NBC_01433 TaxID=2903864 RepID=UPI0022567BCD|nr:hypothetical protein [Streptomyces sp. NBC_01433]MCX4682294.1 hypothetical protein [Streptomyces sp. NBC_01433]
MMIPANSTIKQTTLEKIAKRYKVGYSTAASWPDEPAFPSPVDQGWGRTQLYDEAAVDEWVWENKPEAWVKAHPKQKDKLSLPAGAPKDLMPLQRIGELEGRFLSREATPVATLRTYISRGVLARPDRRAGDGGQPKVEQDMWFRETAYAYITRPRSIRRKVQKGDGEPREPSAFLTQYFEENPGLLTLEKIAELDGKEHGREPTAMTTLKIYISQGKLARPDRKPRDGKTPAVDERMWEPASVLPFFCRPASRRRTVQPREDQAASVEPSAFLTQYFEENPGLLTLEKIAELDGREQGRKQPTAESSLKVYISQGKLARADRLPNDGKTPAVDEPMWTPAAALPFLATPRQASRGKRDSAMPADGELREPSASLQRYFAKHPGLLSLETIAELDGRELGRKPTALTTLRSYISQGRLVRADRLPNDGRTPAVDEPMWTPAAALPYLLRPVGRGGAAAKKTAADGDPQGAGQ